MLFLNLPRFLIRYTGLVCLSCFAFLNCLHAEDLQSVRTWTSNDGNTIQARLLDPLDRDALRFQLADGTQASIPLSRLSNADQADILAWLKRTETSIKNAQPALEESENLPQKHQLKRVPLIEQYGNYCVPASASMIANFHGIEIDQFEIAQLTSADSAGNHGAYPFEMLMALEKIGFTGREISWENAAKFHSQILPQIQNALLQKGPIYVSFKPGVFGSSGHGCVILGYNNRKEELLFYNPWGNAFEKSYASVAYESSGIVIIEPPQASPVATDAAIARFKNKFPRLENSPFDCLDLLAQFKDNAINFEILWCNRYDTLLDRKFADETASKDGRLILKLAFRRNPAVLIPNSPKGITESYYFVTRPPEGGARYSVREISTNGWSAPELKTLGSLTREWPTHLKNDAGQRILWQLPLFELALTD